MIELKTYAGSNVTPQNDAIMNDTNTLNNGIYYGCNVTIKDATTLHITAGQGIVYGRLFEVLDSDIPVSLSPSGTLLGQLYVHIDLSNIAAPIQILVDTGETLADLEDDPQLNIDSGITDMQLAAFTVSTVGISDLVETFEAVSPIRAVLGDADISAIGDGTVKGSIRALNTRFTDIIKVKTVTTSATFNGQGFQELNLTVAPDNGYKCIGVVGYFSSQWPFNFTRCQLTSATNVNVLLVCTYTSEITTNVGVYVLEVKI